MKKWTTSNAPVSENSNVTRQFGEFFGGILVRRGVNTTESAKEFFGCTELSDPLLMRDMQQAAEMIREAMDEGKKIVVYGDYDCDGVTATAIMYSYLQANGADVDYYIPDRSEGFGMNIPSLEKIVSGGAELIITVDNGIAAVKEAEFLKEKGVKLIITDHHRPGETLPVCDACVDPNRADDISPFKDLCGAGIALKLLIAIEEDAEFILDTYAHLAAIGTIGDVVPLKGENRYIVQRGLENIRNEQNAGLTALINTASRTPKNITSTDVAFCVCPRINAAGRMAHAEKALRLLLCEDDIGAAKNIAEELSALNSERKKQEDKILAEINEMTANDPLITKQRVIVLSGKGWHHGIIGIVCARLLEKYDKPIVIISVEDGKGRGSVRSIEGFSAFDMLSECSAPLTTFGGHPGAGGFSLPESKIEDFKQRVVEYTKKYYPKMPDVSLFADMEIDLGVLTLDNVKKLSLLEPCGESNSVPKFLIRNVTVKSKTALSDGKYTSFIAQQGNCSIKALSFKLPFAKFFPKAGDKIDIIAAADINEYNGTESVQLRLVEYRPSGFREDRFLAASRVYEEICRGEGCDKRLASRVIPQSREELMKIYDLIKRNSAAMTAEELAVFDGSVNYCMLKVTLDAFFEAGMIAYENNAPKTVPISGKRDLFQSGLLHELNEQLTIEN